MANPQYGQNTFDEILGNAKLLKNKLAYIGWNWAHLGYEAKSDSDTDTGYTLKEGHVNGSLWDGDGAAASSPTRGVFCGGDTPTLVNTIDYVEILTTGNAVDFGDQTVKRDRVAGCSNAHGGL